MSESTPAWSSWRHAPESRMSDKYRRQRDEYENVGRRVAANEFYELWLPYVIGCELQAALPGEYQLDHPDPPETLLASTLLSASKFCLRHGRGLRTRGEAVTWRGDKLNSLRYVGRLTGEVASTGRHVVTNLCVVESLPLAISLVPSPRGATRPSVPLTHSTEYWLDWLIGHLRAAEREFAICNVRKSPEYIVLNEICLENGLKIIDTTHTRDDSRQPVVATSISGPLNTLLRLLTKGVR
jgi:hypothetical protein